MHLATLAASVVATVLAMLLLLVRNLRRKSDERRARTGSEPPVEDAEELPRVLASKLSLPPPMPRLRGLARLKSFGTASTVAVSFTESWLVRSLGRPISPWLKL
jgi:hypothetical protein